MDQAAAHELELYIDSDADLYRQQGQPILRNLANKAAQGKYDHAKAVKLYMYLMDNGAKKYAREFGGEWNRIFSVPTRKAVAENFATNFETEYKYGNYDNFLTKVSAKKKSGGASNLAGGHAKFSVGEKVYLRHPAAWTRSAWAKRGYYYVEVVSDAGGMVLQDVERDSLPGEFAYALSKSPRGGAVWFSQDALQKVKRRK